MVKKISKIFMKDIYNSAYQIHEDLRIISKDTFNRKSMYTYTRVWIYVAGTMNVFPTEITWALIKCQAFNFSVLPNYMSFDSGN